MNSLSDVLKELGIPYVRTGTGRTDEFTAVVPISQVGEGNLIYVNKPGEGTLDLLRRADYGAVLLEATWGNTHCDEIKDIEASIFLVDHPRLVVGRVMKRIYPHDETFSEGIHPTADIDPDAIIHPTVSIGPYCIIGKCRIGERSRIHGFTVIKDNVFIWKNVVIREFCLIGGCGFGFARDRDGHLERLPHIGRVVIEDDVELFPYVNVDRGTLHETRIKRGTKIDHYCHIGHNTAVGEDSVITAGTVLCGGSSIGSRSWVGVGSIMKEDISVGDDAVIGLGAVVNRDVEDGKIVAGIPARPLKEK